MWRIHVKDHWTRRSWLEAYERADDGVFQFLEQVASPDGGTRFWAYVAMRDIMERREFYAIGLEVSQGQEFSDPVWINSRIEAHRARLAELEASSDWQDCAQIQGQRKIIRKWIEQAVFFAHDRLANDMEALGQSARTVGAAWREWISRDDRKAFDGELFLDPEARAASEKSATEARQTG